MVISWVARVNPSHPYLENDPAPSFDPTICAFHLGFSLGSRRGFLQSIDHPSNKPPPGWGAVRPGQCAYRIVEGINYSAGNSAGPAQCLRFRHDSVYGSRTNSLAGNIATHQAALPWNTPGSIGLGWPQKPHGPAAGACKPDRNEAHCLRHLRSSPGEKNTPPYHGISIYIL